jgi:hypothetical protein
MTGFTVSAFLSRNRVSPKEAFEGLELCEEKLSCTVLRGLDGSNPVRLLGYPGVSEIDSQKPISRYKSGLAERIADLPSNEPDAWQKSITN